MSTLKLPRYQSMMKWQLERARPLCAGERTSGNSGSQVAPESVTDELATKYQKNSLPNHIENRPGVCITAILKKRKKRLF